MTDRWYLGRDGKYHWVNCWLIAACGHLCFTSSAKSSAELSTSECCEECLMRFFDNRVSMPVSAHPGVTA